MDDYLVTAEIGKLLDLDSNELSEGNFVRRRGVAIKLLESALSGKIQAIKLIFEIMEGKLAS